MGLFNKDKSLKKELKVKTSGYLIAAFGLVAALAWNDAIKSLIEYLFPINKDSVPAKFIFAVILTGIVVLASLVLIKFTEKDKK